MSRSTREIMCPKLTQDFPTTDILVEARTVISSSFRSKSKLIFNLLWRKAKAFTLLVVKGYCTILSITSSAYFALFQFREQNNVLYW